MTNYYDSFFYPGVPEATKQIVNNKELWPMLADIVIGSERQLLITQSSLPSALSTATYVLLGCKDTGHPVLQVTKPQHGAFKVYNWYRDLKKRGANRQQLESVNSRYLTDKLRSEYKTVLLRARGHLTEQKQAVIGHYYDNAYSQGGTRIDSNYYVDVSKLYAVLETVFGGASVIDLPPATSQYFKGHYERWKAQLVAGDTFKTRVAEFMGHEKWLIGWYGTSYGVGIGAGKFDAEKKLVETIPTRLYRSFDDFYQRCPEHADSLKSSLIIFKTFREKHIPSTEKLDFLDPDKFICRGIEVYEDVGAVQYYTSDNVNTPQWLFVDK